MQASGTECDDPNGIEAKYAPDAEVARGLAEEQIGSSDRTCGACRPKGQAEGTGEDCTTRGLPGPS